MKKLLIIGDSIAIHFAPFLKTYLSDTFEFVTVKGELEALADLDNPVGSNFGTSTNVLRFTKENIDKIDCNCVLINCGLHDLKVNPLSKEYETSLIEYERNLEEITSLFINKGVKIIWYRLVPVYDQTHNPKIGHTFLRFHEDVKKFNALADRIMASKGIPRIDLYQFTLQFGESAVYDHVHFTEEVRALQAAYIAGCLTMLIT